MNVELHTEYLQQVLNTYWQKTGSSLVQKDTKALLLNIFSIVAVISCKIYMNMLNDDYH